MGAFKTPHNKVMKLTNMQAKLLLFAALGFILGYCQQEDIISDDYFQTPALRRTSELDQAGYGWRRRRGDHARRERQGKQNLRNAERGNKERKSKGNEAKTKKAAAERKSKNTAAERKSKNAAALKKEGTQKAQKSKKDQKKAKARRKLEKQHKHAHQQFRAAAAKKAGKKAKKADIIRKWREIYKKSVAKAVAKLKRTFSEKVAKAKEKGSKKNVNVDKVACKCVKGRGKSEILGSMLLQFGEIRKRLAKKYTGKKYTGCVDNNQLLQFGEVRKGLAKKYANENAAKGQKAIEEGNTSRAGKIATKAALNGAKDLLDCVEDQIPKVARKCSMLLQFGEVRKGLAKKYANTDCVNNRL